MFRNISWTVDTPFDRPLVIYKSLLHEEKKLAPIQSDGRRQRIYFLISLSYSCLFVEAAYKLKALGIGF